MPELRLLPGLPEVMKTFLLILAALLLSSQVVAGNVGFFQEEMEGWRVGHGWDTPELRRIGWQAETRNTIDLGEEEKAPSS